VSISNVLKASNQCRLFAEATKIIEVLNRTIEYTSVNIMVKLYKTLIHPRVEYGTSIWSPYYVKEKRTDRENPAQIY